MTSNKEVFLLFSFILVFNFSPKVLGIHVERVVVPPHVIAGKSAELQCLYKQEGDELYSLKWWRGDDNFYQYIPPRRSSYPIPGVRVNMTATYSINKFAPPGLERVILDTVGLDTAGVFKCEAMTDKIFETVSKEANMTVIVPPSRPPLITGDDKVPGPVNAGQQISLMCSAAPAKPAPSLVWKINNHPVSKMDWVTYHPVMFARGLAQVVSSLNFVVTQKIIDESTHGLIIDCITTQNESSYSQMDTVVLTPERNSYFWFFFSRGCFLTPPSLLTFVIVGLLYRCFTWSTI